MLERLWKRCEEKRRIREDIYRIGMNRHEPLNGSLSRWTVHWAVQRFIEPFNGSLSRWTVQLAVPTVIKTVSWKACFENRVLKTVFEIIEPFNVLVNRSTVQWTVERFRKPLNGSGSNCSGKYQKLKIYLYEPLNDLEDRWTVRWTVQRLTNRRWTDLSVSVRRFWFENRRFFQKYL